MFFSHIKHAWHYNDFFLTARFLILVKSILVEITIFKVFSIFHFVYLCKSAIACFCILYNVFEFLFKYYDDFQTVMFLSPVSLDVFGEKFI